MSEQPKEDKAQKEGSTRSSEAGENVPDPGTGTSLVRKVSEYGSRHGACGVYGPPPSGICRFTGRACVPTRSCR